MSMLEGHYCSRDGVYWHNAKYCSNRCPYHIRDGTLTMPPMSLGEANAVVQRLTRPEPQATLPTGWEDADVIEVPQREATITGRTPLPSEPVCSQDGVIWHPAGDCELGCEYKFTDGVLEFPGLGRPPTPVTLKGGPLGFTWASKGWHLCWDGVSFTGNALHAARFGTKGAAESFMQSDHVRGVCTERREGDPSPTK